MDSATILAAGCGAAVMLLLVALVLLVTRRRRSRADLERALLAAQRETDDLRHRLDELSGATAHGHAHLDAVLTTGPPNSQPAEFVITHVGEPGDASDVEAADAVRVPDRMVLSATLGEPLVKVAAFSHGVRRALSAESRNRIWFEMRREVRSSRRRRRRLRKDVMRDYKARERAPEDLA
ncbi:MAG TPA: hypothetical protein VFE07_13095 [Marmoricola sp.]|jgi:hypothetical protein|nr:hypothetical protein [Marmoricola sp.]